MRAASTKALNAAPLLLRVDDRMGRRGRAYQLLTVLADFTSRARRIILRPAPFGAVDGAAGRLAGGVWTGEHPTFEPSFVGVLAHRPYRSCAGAIERKSPCGARPRDGPHVRRALLALDARLHAARHFRAAGSTSSSCRRALTAPGWFLCGAGVPMGLVRFSARARPRSARPAAPVVELAAARVGAAGGGGTSSPRRARRASPTARPCRRAAAAGRAAPRRARLRLCLLIFRVHFFSQELSRSWRRSRRRAVIAQYGWSQPRRQPALRGRERAVARHVRRGRHHTACCDCTPRA